MIEWFSGQSVELPSIQRRIQHEVMQLLTYASHNRIHQKLQRWDRAEGSIGQQLYLPPLRSSIGLQGAPPKNPNPTLQQKSQLLP